MKKPVCPFNYMEANLGLSRGDAECLLFKNTRDGMRELLDIAHDDYREIYSELQELISKSENLLYTPYERAQLSEAIENAKKR